MCGVTFLRKHYIVKIDLTFKNINFDLYMHHRTNSVHFETDDDWQDKEKLKEVLNKNISFKKTFLCCTEKNLGVRQTGKQHSLVALPPITTPLISNATFIRPATTGREKSPF